MALSHDQIADLVTTTQKELGRMKFTLIATDLQSFEVMPKILKKDKITEDTGEGFQKNVMVDIGSGASNVGFYHVDNPNVSDHMKTVTYPFRFSRDYYAFDRYEKAINSGPEKIVDLVEVRRKACMIRIATLMETDFWAKPADSSDNVTPWGIRMFLVSSATTGFNGTNPSGFSSGYAGLSSTTYPNWANYTAQYAAVTKADLIKKMRTARRKTNFESPISIPDYRKGRGQRYVVYVNETTISSMEDVGESSNENLGRDLAPYDGEMTFHRNPIRYIPKLDEDSTNPVIMLDWSTVEIGVLKGFHMEESKARVSPTQSNVMVVTVNNSWNPVCIDRRRNTIITL